MTSFFSKVLLELAGVGDQESCRGVILAFERTALPKAALR